MYGLVALTLQDLRITLLDEMVPMEAAEVVDDLAAELHSLSQLETLGLRAERRLHTPEVRDALVRLAAKAAALPSLRRVRLPWPLTSSSTSESGKRVRRAFVALREAKPDFAVVPIQSRVDGSYGHSSFPRYWAEDDGGGGNTEADGVTRKRVPLPIARSMLVLDPLRTAAGSCGFHLLFGQRSVVNSLWGRGRRLQRLRSHSAHPALCVSKMGSTAAAALWSRQQPAAAVSQRQLRCQTLTQSRSRMIEMRMRVGVR